MKELIIIDGHALAYRAHFAMMRNPLINNKGMNTSAIYGFTGYLLRLLNKFPDAAFTVTFDSKGPSFRKDIYEEYKVNRKPMPDELRLQIPYLDKLVELMGIPVFKEDGLEADDIIAHIARFGDANDMAVKIVTKDKDLMQLVNDNIHQLAPETGGKFDEYDAERVKEKMGVSPNRIADLLAMMGDTADNVPGLPGVGPKTALKILQSAGSVESLMENPDRAGTPKLAAKVRENLDLLKVSWDLVVLDGKNVDIPLTLESVQRSDADLKEVKKLFEELEFGAYLKDPFFKDMPKPEPIKFNVECVTTEPQLKRIIDEITAAGSFSIDTETTSLDIVSAELVGISLAVTAEKAYYIPVGHNSGENYPLDSALTLLKPLLESEVIGKIGQNLKFDYQVFQNYSITLRSITFDTMIAAYIVDPTARNFGMDDLAQRILDIETIHIEDLIGKGKSQKSFAEVSIEEATAYAGEDAIVPLMLKDKLEPLLEERQMQGLFAAVEMPLVTVLAKMEYAGIKLDVDHLKKLSVEYADIVELAQKEVFDLAGEVFNLNSTRQLGTILFEKLGLPSGKKTKTGYSTNVDVLTELAKEYEIARKILVYREKQKLLSTYIDALPLKISSKTERLHASFNQTVTATGRLSSSEPNLQNIPVRTEDGRKIREAFIAREGCEIIAADYSQIELRLLAHFSQDEVLVEAFKNGEDIHRQTAAKIYGVPSAGVTDDMRRAAKTINFGLMYGMGPFKLGGELGVSFSEAKQFITSYFEQFPTVKTFMEQCVENAREKGYTETLFGRKRFLPELNARNRMVRENAERISVNTPVQGTAADIVKVAMISLSSRIEQENLPLTMMIQVHDELLFEVESSRAEEMKRIVQESMEEACKLLVPLQVDVKAASNWSEAH